MSARLFIFEGPDCSGKSTLAKHAAIQLNATYFHASGAKTFHPAMHDYHMNMLENAEVNLANGHNVVFDRFWPSELIYGQLFRASLSDRIYGWPEILQATAKLNPVYIICDDPEIVERHEANKDDDHAYNKTVFTQVVNDYRSLTLEMMDSPALPNLWHPRTPPSEMKFDVRRYSMAEHGATLGTFVDSL